MDYRIRQHESFPWLRSELATPEELDLSQAVRRHAKGYWRKRLLAEAPVRRPQDRVAQAENVRPNRSYWPPRSPQAPPSILDLTPNYNGMLDGRFGVAGYETDTINGLTFLPRGLQRLANTDWDLRGVVILRRSDYGPVRYRELWSRFPEVEPIPLLRSFRRLHVLHAIDTGIMPDGTTVAVADGTVVGSYVWRYADGTTREWPIIYGRDLRNWWKLRAETQSATPDASVAWTGTNTLTGQYSASLRLYRRTYENPKPETDVSTIEFRSALTAVSPFLVAMTLEP